MSKWQSCFHLDSCTRWNHARSAEHVNINWVIVFTSARCTQFKENRQKSNTQREGLSYMRIHTYARIKYMYGISRRSYAVQKGCCICTASDFRFIQMFWNDLLNFIAVLGKKKFFFFLRFWFSHIFNSQMSKMFTNTDTNTWNKKKTLTQGTILSKIQDRSSSVSPYQANQ